jgi:hypothetical protein
VVFNALFQVFAHWGGVWLEVFKLGFGFGCSSQRVVVWAAVEFFSEGLAGPSICMGWLVGVVDRTLMSSFGYVLHPLGDGDGGGEVSSSGFSGSGSGGGAGVTGGGHRL